MKRTTFSYWSFSGNVFGPASHFIIKRSSKKEWSKW